MPRKPPPDRQPLKQARKQPPKQLPKQTPKRPLKQTSKQPPEQPPEQPQSAQIQAAVGGAADVAPPPAIPSATPPATLPAAPPAPVEDEDFAAYCARIRACRVCEKYLPLGPKPIFQLAPTATILVISQAPGRVAHTSGVPFSDASGAQLRLWMGVSEAEFYDASRVAIFPMGLCYPGVQPGGGDAPPRPECAPLWQAPTIARLPNLRLTLLVGSYALNAMLGPGKVGERVRDFQCYLPRYFPLPHPSWRSRIWMSRNPWFAEDVVPRLQAEVRSCLSL